MFKIHGILSDTKPGCPVFAIVLPKSSQYPCRDTYTLQARTSRHDDIVFYVIMFIWTKLFVAVKRLGL